MMRTLERKKKLGSVKLGMPGEIPQDVQKDRKIKTHERENPRRRSIVIEKNRGTFGFELQTYAIHHRGSNEVEVCTYVCEVYYDGPAYISGMRPGDIILSVNGVNVEGASHGAVVELIKRSPSSLRLVVIFEDCVKKVQLNKRLVKLKRMLYDKKLAFRALQAQEERLVRGLGRYEFASSLASSLMSDDSGIGIGLGHCASTSTSMLHSKSQSLSSINSGTFSLSMIPGNESLEEIAIMDI